MTKYEPITISDNMNLQGNTVRIKRKDKAWIFGRVDGESAWKLYFFNCSIQEFGPVSSRESELMVPKDDIDTIEIERTT